MKGLNHNNDSYVKNVALACNVANQTVTFRFQLFQNSNEDLYYKSHINQIQLRIIHS